MQSFDIMELDLYTMHDIKRISNNQTGGNLALTKMKHFLVLFSMRWIFF
jgi:hypothetical protein